MNKKWLTITLLACILTGVTTYYFSHGLGSQHTQPELEANVYVLHESLNGKELMPETNVICNIGGLYARNTLGFGNVSGAADNTTYPIDHISMGNASVAATLTKLTTEATTAGFTRARGTSYAWYNTTGNFYAWNVTKMFTATGTLRLNAVGLHWLGTSDSDNNMFAASAITETTFNSGDNCTITWVITVGQS